MVRTRDHKDRNGRHHCDYSSLSSQNEIMCIVHSGSGYRRLRLNRRLLALVLVLIVAIGTGMTLWFVPLNRVLFSSTNLTPPYSPDFLFGNFSVTNADTGIRNPIVKVSVDLTRNEEYIDFVVQFCLLNFTLEQLEQVSNISTLVVNDQLVGRYWFVTEPPTMDFPLPNISCTYVWVLWIEAASIPLTWTIDVSLTLEFSII
ncbi:MAG: hypothetical protein ACFFDQ_08540 [Candidatus Thorarchaeota archaeon]